MKKIIIILLSVVSINAYSQGIGKLLLIPNAQTNKMDYINDPSQFQGVNANLTKFGKVTPNSLTEPYKPYGIQIYNKSFWSSLDLTTDFVVEGVAPTLSTVGGIVYAGGSSNYNNDLLLSYVNYDDNVELEVTFVVNSLTGYSPFVGKRNYQQFNGQAMFAGYNLTTNASILSLAYFDNPAGPRAAVLSGYAVAVNDYCKIKYTKNGSVFYSTFVDITQGFSCVCSWTNAESDAETLADMAIWNYNSSCEIKQINLWSNTNPKPYIMCVGDSKTKNPSQIQKYPTFLNALGVTECWAAQSTTLSEQYVYARPYLCKYYRPEYVILNIGRNDITDGFDTTQLKANYIGLKKSLDSIGAKTFHLLIPDADANQTMLWNFIKRTYSSDSIIDMVAAGWTDALYLASDSTHPNAQGARFIAQTIINKGKIPQSNVYNYNPYRDDSQYSNGGFTGSGSGVNTNRYAKTFQNNDFCAPQNFYGNLTSAQTYGVQMFYQYTATANNQIFSSLNINANPVLGSFTGCKIYAIKTANANSLFGSTAIAPSVLGEFGNISGVPKFFNTAVERFAMQTDVAGTVNQHAVYNSSGLIVPTTIYSTLGDLNYGGASGLPTTLTGNVTSTKKFLVQTGNGTTSAAPAWGLIVAGDIPSLSATYVDLTSTQTVAGAKTFSNAAVFSSTLSAAGITSTNGVTVSTGGLTVSTANGVMKAPLYYSSSAVPTQVAGTGAGTSPTITITGTNQDGKIAITTGTTPAASSVITTITYSGTGFTTNSFPDISPGNLAAVQLTTGPTGSTPFVSSATTTTFVLTSNATALTASTAYVFYYHIGGN